MAYYGSGTYGVSSYGLSVLPTSPDFDIFDFIYPDESVMSSLLSFSEVATARPYALPYYDFTVNYDLCMFSDDDGDSGLEIDVSIPDGFTLEFSFLPTELPPDFSSISNSRFFVAAYNQFGRMFGLLMSENEGIALAQEGAGSYSRIVDSDDLFDEGTSYYIFRATINKATGRGNLYITRKDLLSITGHQLRYTFNVLESPEGTPDKILIEVVGNSTNSTTICLDSIRLSSQELIPNHRPIAIPGDDQIVNLNSYASFDGRGSYDPEGVPSSSLIYWWTVQDAPENSDMWLTGTASTPSDISGYTNVVNAASGNFSGVVVGDVLVIGSSYSNIMFVASDTSYVVAVDRVFIADLGSIEFKVLKQSAWGGSWTASTTFQNVLSVVSSLPGSPSEDDAYLVDSGIEIEKIATWNGTIWVYSAPSEDDLVYIEDEYKTKRYIGGAHPVGQWEDMDPFPWELSNWSGRTLNIPSLLPTATGLHTVSLVVNDGELSSIPTEVILNVQESRVPFGVIPDLSWIWNLLSDFWDIVDGKEKLEVLWSGITQVAAGWMMELWQHDYAKGLFDIQRLFQKRWLHYQTFFYEDNHIELPASIYNPMSFGGFSGSPGNNRYFYETGIDLTGFTSKNALVLDGEVYRISRYVEDPIAAPGYPTGVILSDQLPEQAVAHPSHWQIRPTVISQSSDFSNATVRAGDTAVFEIVDTNDSSSQEISVHVYGARSNVLCFDDSGISSYLANDRYTVRFKLAHRRSLMSIDSSIVSIPQLQEVINTSAVDGADTPIVQNNNFFVEDMTTVPGSEIRIIRFACCWFEEIISGFSGEMTANDTFQDSLVNFNTAIGDNGTDIKDYYLVLDSKKYRLDTVASQTTVQLEDDAVAVSSGLIWSIVRQVDPPEYLWAEVTHIDNEPTIYSNFGRLVGLEPEVFAARTDDLDYLAAVQGLWYTYWFGPTPYNLKVGSQILLGLPFAEARGLITSLTSPYDATRSRILVQDSDNESVVRTYYYPTALGLGVDPATGSTYSVGDTVARFSPLSGGVEVKDLLTDSRWFEAYFNSGDFREVWKIHMFGIVMDSAAFSIDNMEFVIDYINRIKPKYTYPWFVVSQSASDTIDVVDDMMSGPAVPDQTWPASGMYPTDWPIEPTPLGWASSPLSVPRSSDPVLVRDGNGTKVPTPFVPKDYAIQHFGGLHLSDVPARVADSWTGTLTDGSSHTPVRAQGTFCIDSQDGRGNYIHRVDDKGVYPGDNILTDSDMELGGTANWPAIGTPNVLAKHTGTKYEGSQCIEIEDSVEDQGCEQEFPGPDYSSLQVAVTGYVWVRSGQAVLRIYDHDDNVVAQLRFGQSGGTYPPSLSNWIPFTLHVMDIVGSGNPVRFEAVTGPAGGQFYIDVVAGWAEKLPWVQWGVDRKYTGRTGGYTRGGAPDDLITMSMFEEF